MDSKPIDKSNFQMQDNFWHGKLLLQGEGTDGPAADAFGLPGAPPANFTEPSAHLTWAHRPGGLL